MKEVIIILGFAALCFIHGCDGVNSTGADGTGNVAYFSSFESVENTVGWHLNGGQVLVNEAAPGCGKWSLAVTGGCIQPAASLDVPLRCGAGNYVLSCWAKSSSDSTGLGSVILATSGSWPRRDFIELRVKRGEWTFYETKQQLYCSSADSLRLEIWSGGYVSTGPVHVDFIKVEKID